MANDTYRHGIYSQELPTAITPMISVATPIVAVGSAPIHIAKNPAETNTPVLCHTLAEFVEQFGWSDTWTQFTLCEVAYACFQLYNVAPVIFINVLGSDKHLKGIQSTVLSSANSPYTLAIEAPLSQIKATSGNTADYTVSLSAGWQKGGVIPSTDENTFTYKTISAIKVAVAGDGNNKVWLSKKDYQIYYGVEEEQDSNIEQGEADSWRNVTENVVDLETVTSATACWRVKLTAEGAAKMASNATKTLTLGKAKILTKNKDYTVGHDDEGHVVLTLLKTTNITGNSLTIWYRELSISTIKTDEVIGGYDVTTGKNTGLECIEDIYPKFGLVAGTLIAPYFSRLSAVGQIMKAKVEQINGCFKAMAVADISSYSVKTYTGVNERKNSTNYIGGQLIACYPQVALGDNRFYLSTHCAAIMAKTDAAHDDLPYKSPSNEQLQCDRSVLYDGTEYSLGRSQANYLNGIGIVTALNFVGGWRLWGNRTSAYPSTSDPKDSFIPVRRMMNWINNTLITSFWSKIDYPITKRLVESVVDSAQIWLNGLVARGALVGGSIQILEEENPITDLSDGIIRFHVSICPPSPAREIEFVMEYQPKFYESLFE